MEESGSDTNKKKCEGMGYRNAKGWVEEVKRNGLKKWEGVSCRKWRTSDMRYRNEKKLVTEVGSEAQEWKSKE